MGELKETKAQRVERLKHAKNAWEHFDEIREFARKGYFSIPPDGWAHISERGAFINRETARELSAERAAKARALRISWCASASPTAC